MLDVTGESSFKLAMQLVRAGVSNPQVAAENAGRVATLLAEVDSQLERDGAGNYPWLAPFIGSISVNGGGIITGIPAAILKASKPVKIVGFRAMVKEGPAFLGAVQIQIYIGQANNQALFTDGTDARDITMMQLVDPFNPRKGYYPYELKVGTGSLIKFVASTVVTTPNMVYTPEVVALCVDDPNG